MRQNGLPMFAALFLLLLAVVPPYALSTGPAWRMVQDGSLDRKTCEVIYSPLFAIPVLDECLARYSFRWAFRNRPLPEPPVQPDPD